MVPLPESENARNLVFFNVFQWVLVCFFDYRPSGTLIMTCQPYPTDRNILKVIWAAWESLLTHGTASRAPDCSKVVLQYRYKGNYIGNVPKSDIRDPASTDGPRGFSATLWVAPRCLGLLETFRDRFGEISMKCSNSGVLTDRAREK